MAAHKTALPIHYYAPDLAKCLFSAFIMRSSACTINDIFDKDMDAGVGTWSIWYYNNKASNRYL